MFNRQQTIACNTTKPWEYHVIAEICSLPECGAYTAYGLTVQCGDETQATIHDISTNQHFVQQLAALFNRHQLSPRHFREVVEDFLP